MAGKNGKKGAEAEPRKVLNAEGMYGADEGFEDAPGRADFMYYKPEDDEGNLIALRGVCLGRFLRPADPKDPEKTQYFYLVLTTGKALVFDREQEMHEVDKGQVVWVDERFDIAALADYIPIRGDNFAHEVVIIPMDKIKHPKKAGQTIWRFHPVKHRKIAHDAIPGGSLPTVRLPPQLGTPTSNEPLPPELANA